jgi:galactose oxidase-like protein/glyoxal oxidase-like protein/List-Bact-rpt repeat protein
MKLFALLTFALIGLGLLLLHACQDVPEVTQQSSAVAAVGYRLTVSGTGTGNGVVTSSPAGINCTVTAGTSATTGCSAIFNQGVTVTLTAVPRSGHSFVGWGTPCRGTGTCRVLMDRARAVSAQFLRGPFTITISSVTPGGGSGRVRSQSGLSPIINCLITNGRPAATGCSGRYPANTSLTLTAIPNAGFVFNGWPEPSCGTGSCQLAVIQNRTIPATFSVPPPADPAVRGRWEPVFTTPVVAVHVHVLLTGNVLLWGDKGGDGQARLWAPSTGFSAVAPKPFRIYCSGHSFLPDGRLLVTGGTSNGTRGLRVGAIFDPASRSWSATSSMAQGRYYPTNTTLPNGDVLTVSGHDTTLTVVTIPEVWNGSGWRRLTGAGLSIPNPYYPAMFVAPNGQVFLAGFPVATRYLDVTGTGHWTFVANRNVADRTLGSAVMYAPGKILYAGGGDPPTATAEVIDLNQASPSWRTVPSMSFPRRQLNATLLADGTVLVTGGTSGDGFNNQAAAVHVAELWNPETEMWTRMASEDKNRTYHATAVLLPSGRVLSSGSGEGGGIPLASSEFSAQVFTPRYLFNSDGSMAARPSITSVPPRLSYGSSFTVQTPNAASVARGNLIRLSSVTHAFNQSQLIYPLTFEVTSSTSLRATAPTNANLAPPGPYMLFLINGSGVPSVAKIVTVGP